MINFAIRGFLSLALLAPMAFSQGQSNNAPGAVKNSKGTPEFPFCRNFPLEFNSASDTRTFAVKKNNNVAAGILRVRTRDCCIVGDEWQSEIIARKPNNKSDFAISDGNITTLNGAAILAPFIQGNITISYHQGVDFFPAGMEVEICYSRSADSGDPVSIIAP